MYTFDKWETNVPKATKVNGLFMLSALYITDKINGE